MAFRSLFLVTCLLGTITIATPLPEVEILTQPTPGEQYVFVQTSATGARPVSRKDKQKNDKPDFETAHKLPLSLTYLVNQQDSIDSQHIVIKREAKKSDSPAPAPAGAIKLDIKKLLEQYKDELTTTTSTTASPKVTTKSLRRTANKRTKKAAGSFVVTSPSPVLTTRSSASKTVVDDNSLLASSSKKQSSRIEIKKGPNGQEYEYEYVYYYYDDDEEAKSSNSHDGPARNAISHTPNKSRSSERTTTAPESNEVLPSSKGHNRDRQLDEEVEEERLPANTRFPPRSRNLNTTPLPKEETKATRGRGRGRLNSATSPSSKISVDSVSDETREGARGQTRTSVRRPSLELVDNASFNTHSNTARVEPAPVSPAFPTELPAGPVRFLGATPNESVDPPEPIKKLDDVTELKNEKASDISEDITTVMSPMDKVALDLYAILQGTQKLSGEETESSTGEISTDLTKEADATTVETTTELVIDTTTPTTTTTSTTPLPTTSQTTTTTTEAPIGRNRFKGRGRKTTHSASTTETAPTETKAKAKFNRPNFGGRPRLGGRTTSEASVEQEQPKEETKAAAHSKPTLSRSRFGASRTRSRSTSVAPELSQDQSSSTVSSSRPSLPRPRASFNLKSRGRTTPASLENDSDVSEQSDAHKETTTVPAKTRKIQAGNGVRPLRPGPRINLGRGRIGHITTSTEISSGDHILGSEESIGNSPETLEENSSDASTVADNKPLNKLRNKSKVSSQARSKTAASTPVQVRRVNPLIGRRRQGQTTEASSSEAVPVSVSTDITPGSEENEEAETSPASSSTTEEPRGLNKLLAGRRRATRPAAHH